MKKIIVMGIPHHGNIGDNAIAIAEEKMLKENFKNYEIFFIQEKYLDICAQRVKKYIGNDDIICLHGGGNIGDTYERPKKGRREVIKLYPNNKIIIFPQTAYFSSTVNGKKELEISKDICNNHKNLTIMARERKSYDFMKQNFYNAKIYLTPDIVMSLRETNINLKREGALLLFRSDVEKVLDKKDEEKIKEIAKENFGEIKISDMNLGSGIININGKLRDKIFKSKIEEYRSSKIVITDRLHGMIFAAITETPCIAFGNFNYKILGSYEWLKNLDYIKYCDDVNKINTFIEELKNIKNIKYDNSFANNMILKILKEEIC